MSTRGLWGFRKDGKDKLTYNHSDSYPTGLGESVKKFIANHSTEELAKIADEIVLVDGKSVPTDKQVGECLKYFNGSVSTKDIKEWYCLLRNSQGEPEEYAKGLRYMIDSKEFIKDSLFCEYAYIINIDTGFLEIYVGGKKTPQDNRYHIAKPDNQGYYNCGLLLEIPLNMVKDLSMESVEKRDREGDHEHKIKKTP